MAVIRINFNGIQLLLVLYLDRTSKKNTVPSPPAVANRGLEGENEISSIGALCGLNTIFRFNPLYASPGSRSENFNSIKMRLDKD